VRWTNAAVREKGVAPGGRRSKQWQELRSPCLWPRRFLLRFVNHREIGRHVAWLCIAQVTTRRSLCSARRRLRPTHNHKLFSSKPARRDGCGLLSQLYTCILKRKGSPVR
jgi:hypothetical protein